MNTLHAIVKDNPKLIKLISMVVLLSFIRQQSGRTVRANISKRWLCKLMVKDGVFPLAQHSCSTTAVWWLALTSDLAVAVEKPRKPRKKLNKHHMFFNNSTSAC